MDSLSRLVVVHVLSLTARPPRKRSRTRSGSAIVISAKPGLSASRVNVCAQSLERTTSYLSWQKLIMMKRKRIDT